jgi:valyl-tRNA synthetase
MRLPKQYNPAEYEADIYALWEKKGAFKPAEKGSGHYFSIVMPPPNANADLHIGFGLTIAIEDTIVRYQRMQGKSTLFVPGADHAGFETQVVYEKHLKEQGKSRFDFSREELYQQIWDFVERNKHNFQSQIRALGASADWTRFTYTLDKKVVAQAYSTFSRMWQDGMIYRGKRIVNYCTFHGTSFSDIEVIHEEEDTQLWRIAYPLANGSGEVVIATTRPETKLGQSALMVNPKDNRYKHLIGREVLQPLVPGKPIKIIGDEHVDMAFGTGVVTVTPGHDPNDFEVAQRHDLPIIELITTEGKMSENVPGQFRGMTVLEAREAVAEELGKKGMLRGVESYTHSVAKCYKCGTVIEPLALEQWFVNMESLKQPALQALKGKQINFYPDSKRVQAIRYLEGLRDWNISRQIAWGIPIPAFQNTDDESDWIFDTRVDQETIEVEGKTYRRDPDVFDTWFSSSSWPYTTLNYPDGQEFKDFYPTSLMETAGEILHQWVVRMVMLGLYTTGNLPFKDVYIHGLVLAEGGAKMSKSLGNVVNAMEIIAEYGSDALRMGLIAGRAPAVNRGYDRRRVEEARNFANKLWNVARYAEDKIGDQHSLRGQAEPKSIADHWILYKLSISAKQVSGYMESYRLSETYETVYHFVWDELADWYVEASKTEPNPAFMAYVLESALRLAHPFAPFVTETIWQTLAWEQDKLLMSQLWPQPPAGDAAKAGRFEQVREVVLETRRIGAMLGLKKPKLYYRQASAVAENPVLVAQLAGLSETVQNDSPVGLKLTTTSGEYWLDVDNETAKGYLLKLERDKMAHQSAVRALEGRLANKSYTEKAPKELVEETRSQLEAEKSQLAKIEEDLNTFKNL